MTRKPCTLHLFTLRGSEGERKVGAREKVVLEQVRWRIASGKEREYKQKGERAKERENERKRERKREKERGKSVRRKL